MRRLVTLLTMVWLAGCASAPAGPVAGAESADAAVRGFLAAARGNDMRGLAAVWGNAESPVRDRAKSAEVEQRAMIIICHLRHDQATLGMPQTGQGGRRLIPVDLTQGDLKARTTFTAVQNAKTGRWFVEDVGLAPVTAFCR
ncbi:MAG: hypothetical protein ACKOH8_06260 [Gemmatimonadota bacterium]